VYGTSKFHKITEYEPVCSAQGQVRSILYHPLEHLLAVSSFGEDQCISLFGYDGTKPDKTTATGLPKFKAVINNLSFVCPVSVKTTAINQDDSKGEPNKAPDFSLDDILAKRVARLKLLEKLM